MKRIYICIIFLSVICSGNVFASDLEEDFNMNTSNVASSSEVQKTLSSGVWTFFRVNKNYNSIQECAVLSYSSSNMGYIISPEVNSPLTLTFNARLQNSVNNSNYVEILKSVNNGPFSTVEQVEVSGNNYVHYTVAINDASDNVRIKFLRGKSTLSESSNYNIILDDVKITATSVITNSTAKLELRSENNQLRSGQTICYSAEDEEGSVEKDLVLTNTGATDLLITGISLLGGISIVKAPDFFISPGMSTTLTLKGFLYNVDSPISIITIHSNSNENPSYTVSFLGQ